MPNTVPNRKVICDELLAAAAHDEDIVVLCSDSRGSASLTPFFDEFPERSVEMGIACLLYTSTLRFGRSSPARVAG